MITSGYITNYWELAEFEVNGSFPEVNTTDLLNMASQWLQSPGDPSADYYPAPSGDGIVNLLDFVFLAEHWLEPFTP